MARFASDLFPDPCAFAWHSARARGWAIDDPQAYCPRCGHTSSPAARTPDGCPRCVDLRPHWRRVVRLGEYRQPLERWIHELKFESCWVWAARLGAELADRLGDDDPRTLVCPVPMHALRWWRRGYNQAELLARAIAKRRRWRVAPVLKRPRLTPPQSTVADSRRAANIRGSFMARRVSLAGCTVWLVDDVMTSGATLNVCARLLRRAGADVVNVAVLAVAERK